MNKLFFSSFVVASTLLPTSYAAEKIEPTESEVEAVFSEEELYVYKDAIELLYFFKKDCAPCENTNAVVDEEEKRYPITKVDVDSYLGKRRAVLWNVKRVPSFVLVKRDGYGNAEILRKWVGETGGLRIESEFYKQGVEPLEIDGAFELPPRPFPKPLPPRPRRPGTKPYPQPRPFPFLGYRSFE